MKQVCQEERNGVGDKGRFGKRLFETRASKGTKQKGRKCVWARIPRLDSELFKIGALRPKGKRGVGGEGQDRLFRVPLKKKKERTEPICPSSGEKRFPYIERNVATLGGNPTQWVAD